MRECIAGINAVTTIKESADSGNIYTDCFLLDLCFYTLLMNLNHLFDKNKDRLCYIYRAETGVNEKEIFL